MTDLPDGEYDVVVIDVETSQDVGIVVHFTVTAGPAKGTVVPLRTASPPSDPLALLGRPASLEVVDGAPRVRFDRA